MKAWVAVVSVMLLLVGGCSSAPTDSTATATASATAATDVASSAADPAAIDVGLLPVGPPPGVDFLAGGLLRWHGQTTRTDFPADALYLEILGSVDGRPVLTAYQSDGSRSGDRFWTIDSAGAARRLGATYRSYDYSPRLVASTGHLWVHYSDRTSPRTMWELDARTGQEVATYADDRVPHGLPAADQRLVDAWVARRNAVPDTDARSLDGSLSASTRSVTLATGSGEAVVVRRTSDRSVVGRFAFPLSEAGLLSRVIFEDNDHVLVLTTLSFTRRLGPQQAIVRCSLSQGSCERTTEIAGSMALGVVRPRFEPRP